MSYDCCLNDPVTGETLHTPTNFNHNIAGGTYALGGTSEMWLNVTFNYGSIFRKVIPKEGILELDGKMAVDTIPILENAIEQLQDDIDPDYWKATEGNAKKALYGLLALAKMRPDGVWQIMY